MKMGIFLETGDVSVWKAEEELEDRKQEVIRQSEALSILVRAFREFQFEEEAQLRAKSRQDEAMTVRRYEVLNKTIKILKTVKRYTYFVFTAVFQASRVASYWSWRTDWNCWRHTQQFTVLIDKSF